MRIQRFYSDIHEALTGGEEYILGRKIKVNKNCTDRMTPYDSVTDRITTALMGSASSVLLISSGIVIGGELLDSYRMESLYIIFLLFFVVIFSVVNSRAVDLILGFAAAAVIVYMILVRDSIFSSISIKGSACLINDYLQKWNYYFDTMYSFPNYGYEGVGIFCSAATALFVIILHVVSGILRKKIIFLLYPLIFIIADFLVGLAPGLSGMILMLSGALLALNVDAESRNRKSYGFKGYCMTVVMAVLIIVMSYTVFGRPADMIVAAHDEVREFQSDIEQRIKYWAKYGRMDDDGMVTNDTPQFSGKEVMKVSVGCGDNKSKYLKHYSDREHPLSSMYLKGYHSSDYYYGKWVYDRSDFKNFCESVDLEETAFSQRLLDIEGNNNFELAEDEAVEIEYTGIADKKAYMPYRSYEHTNDEGYGLDITEDFRFVRGNNVDKVRAMRDFAPDLSMYGINYMETEEGYKKESYGSISKRIEQPESNRELERKYSDYVQSNYLEVPDSQKTAHTIADEIIGQSDYIRVNNEILENEVIIEDENFTIKNTVEEDGSDYNNIVFEEEFIIGDENFTIKNTVEEDRSEFYRTNLYRNRMANEVSEYLNDNAEYTLSPEDNGDEDVIEYFLTKSKRGFCVHFASAGVMILRSMGIPARYVTGYVAFPRDFKRETENDAFEASVKDYAAHAWVEIYMEGCGWVPYEMTPAYSDSEEKLPTQWTSDDIKNRYGGESEKAESRDDIVDNHNETNNGGESAVLQQGENTDNLMMILCVIIFIVFITVTIAAIIISRIIKNKNLVTGRIIKIDGDYNRTVKKINKILYVQLIKKRGAKRKFKNDTDYYAALRFVFHFIDDARWAAYAKIVRTASYSDMKVTREDAQLCMSILSDIRNKK